MTEWDVYLVLGSIAAFIIAIVGAGKKFFADPVNKLDKTLIIAITELGVLKESDLKQENRLDRHECRLNDHDKRLAVIEYVRKDPKDEYKK